MSLGITILGAAAAGAGLFIVAGLLLLVRPALGVKRRLDGLTNLPLMAALERFERDSHRLEVHLADLERLLARGRVALEHIDEGTRRFRRVVGTIAGVMTSIATGVATLWPRRRSRAAR